MKIGLITYSRTRNYGGILQAYALYQYLEQQSHDVFFIDYIMKRNNIYDPDTYVKQITSFSRIWGRNAITRGIWKWRYFNGIREDQQKFSDFIERDCSFSRKYFSEEEMRKEPPQADLYMVGSDQVWNSQFGSEGKLDLPYYLHFTDQKKVSYASSFGTCSIPEDHKEKVKEMLKDFQYVSVREETGKQILSELGIPAETVLDPTLLHTKDFWRSLCKPVPVTKPYLLLYQIKFNQEVYRIAKLLAEKRGLELKIVSMNRNDKRKFGRSVLMTPEPGEWLSYIRGASLVYTDSFHASIFSIQFHVPFIVNSASRKGMASRISNLLQLAGLEGQELKEFDGYQALEIAQNRIDWERTDERLEKERERSCEWLKKALLTEKIRKDKL